MPITALYAQVACADLDRSIAWFATLFDRDPDARPMAGLVEWHHGDAAGLQLFEAPDHAGHSTLTLIVDDVRGDRERLSAAGLAPGPVEVADYTSIARLRDPDHNLIILAQPGKA